MSFIITPRQLQRGIRHRRMALSAAAVVVVL